VSVVSVTIPARAEFVHVLRTVVAAVGARVDLPYDSLDDLRMVVDEACSALLAIPVPVETLTMRLSSDESRIEVVVCLDAEGTSWPRPDLERSLPWKVIAGLTDEARFETLPDGPAVRAVKRIPGTGTEDS
jgi:serine/threonine-protein kinase RsbW